MKERIFPFVIALSALSVSASAAFYSVFGLAHLFAGASTEVIIMAGALEVAKLVVASLLYQYWDTINKLLRFYFILAVFILILNIFKLKFLNSVLSLFSNNFAEFIE